MSQSDGTAGTGPSVGGGVVVDGPHLKLPTRPVRRGLWFDVRNNPAGYELMKKIGWTGIFEKYGWPLLKKGDVAVVRFPNTPAGPGELARWGDAAVGSLEMKSLDEVVDAGIRRGVEMCLYIRRPQNGDVSAYTKAEDKMGAACDPLMMQWCQGATRIIDGADRLRLACPWGAEELDQFEDFGGNVVIEPSWLPDYKDDWHRRCLITDAMHHRVQREGATKWRTWDKDVPEIMRVQELKADPKGVGGRDYVMGETAAFVASCRRFRQTCLLAPDLLIDYGFTFEDVGARAVGA